MVSSSLKVGDRYRTISGLPVEVLEIGGDLVQLQSLASDNRLSVPKDYPLRRLDRGETVFEMRDRPYRPRLAGSRRTVTPKPLAPLIDAMLLAGNKTMRGILRELRRKASASCHGKDLKANVRARLYWFRRKGFQADVGSQSRMKVVPIA